VINYTFKDQSENILAINVSMGSQKINLISIYGTNRNDPVFFTDLCNFLLMYPDSPTILGGDWNATFCNTPGPDNIDIYRMANMPSLYRSEQIELLCNNFNLSDPFRILHPDSREFTFRPKNGRANRSRIDFFLISDSLIDCLSSCNIKTAMATELFDHKAVDLHFNKAKFSPIRSINQSILSHPRLSETVYAATVDCYLNHAAPDPNLDLEQRKLELGNFISILRQINDLEFDNELNQVGAGDNNMQLLLDSLARARRILPDPEELNNINISCDDDTFLEVLLNNIKNEIINLQSWGIKVRNLRKNNLIKSITTLKKDYLINGDIISDLEAELNLIVDTELNARIRSMKIFEGLHAEKPNAMFLSLAKKKNNAKLSNIKKNPNGDEFASDGERIEHIVSFYENLYRKPATEPESHVGCIENFLGREILNSDLVKNSILTQDETLDLDQPLTIEELDKACIEGNSSSAPGADGFGMPVIRLCWPFLRHALFRYTNECLRKGRLTQNFRGASIRLIPKKDTVSDIKNWRPISLLSNLYKIISRALNSRLAKVSNRICSRAQKGFNKLRYTQEAVINVWESIAHCRANNIKGAILAADMEKAFDSILLGYLNEVYKFFGIGPYMRSLLTLVGADRDACIILDSGKLSRRFKLERGRPQGDIISPLTFNFCIQILIFKLELDPGIKQIPRNPIAGAGPDPEPDPDPVLDPDPIPEVTLHNGIFRFESDRQTDKNEALADDNTTITLFQLASLRTIKKILEDFYLISGLKCNTGKTVIMPTFDFTELEGNMVRDLGFQVADNITLLGIKINNKLDSIIEIFTGLKNKIVSLISFWDRFRLSLPGRITILKTCLISQLCYTGCFLPAPDNILNEIQVLLDNYVVRGLRVSKDRLYLDPSLGGLGCYNLKNFLTAQACSWFVRCFKFPIDNWRCDLVRAAPNRAITQIRSLDINSDTNPLIHYITTCFEHFYAKFSEVDGNYKSAYIFGNPAFTRDATTNLLLDKQFFGHEFYNANKNAIRSMRLCDFFRGGRMIDLEVLRESGLILTPAIWIRLQAAARLATGRLKKDDDSDNISQTIEEFLTKSKKGSKKIRKILEIVPVAFADPNNLQIVRSFNELIDLAQQDQKLTKLCLSSWNRPALQNNMREFLFKQRNNQLSLNNRLNAFDINVDPRCNFCRILNNNTRTRDSFSHLFFNCPVTRVLLQQFANIFEPNLDIGSENFKKLYWYGGAEGVEGSGQYTLFIMDCFRFIIWNFKLRRKIPNWPLFERELFFLIETTVARNIGLRNSVLNTNLIANFLRVRG